MKLNLFIITIISGLFISSALHADGVITGAAKVKVKNGTHWIEKGSAEVKGGGSFIIEGMVTINGYFINLNNSGIQIRNTSDFTGSLIYNSGYPNATVENYFHAFGSYLVGVPVNTAIAGDLFFNDPQTALYSFSDGSSITEITDEFIPLIPGQGYYLQIDEGSTDAINATVTGSLTSAELVLNDSTTVPLEYNTVGRNLISNPYASAIDLYDENIMYSGMELSTWIYDNEAQKYKFRNAAGYGTLESSIIDMGEAFFVRALSSQASITIPPEARRHAAMENNSRLNQTEIENYLILQLQKDSQTDELWVGFNENATDGFDNGIDISKMFTFGNQPQLYCRNDNHEFCVNIFEPIGNQSKTIPVYIRAGLSGSHMLNLQEFNGFAGFDVLLEDTENGTFTDVESMISYVFDAEAGIVEQRFILHINPAGSGLNSDMGTNDVNMYAYNNHLYIKNNGKYGSEEKNVSLYDLNGRMLANYVLSPNSLDVVQLGFDTKMIVVQVRYKKDVVTKKIMNL